MDDIKINDTADKLNQAIASGAMPDPGPPKRRNPKAPCCKCGKPTRYGLGKGALDQTALCAKCDRVTAALIRGELVEESPTYDLPLSTKEQAIIDRNTDDKINQLPRVCHPGAFAAPSAAGAMDRSTEPTTNNATGWTDDPNAKPKVHGDHDCPNCDLPMGKDKAGKWCCWTCLADAEKLSPTPCSPPASPSPTQPSAPGCTKCHAPMVKTSEGWRCEGCTKSLRQGVTGLTVSPNVQECVGCDYNIDGLCTIPEDSDDGQCPIMAPKVDGPHGPTTEAEATRIRAAGELAARAMEHECDCGSRSWSWAQKDRHQRIGVVLTCQKCGETERHLLTRENLYSLAVAHRLLVVRRDPHRAFYQLDRIEAVAVCLNPDHDVLTFRAGGETQCFPVEDAEPVIGALTKAWGQP